MSSLISPGTQLDSYRIEALLGEGGMAQVYRAWHAGLQRHEALKALLPHLAHDRQFVERFLQEARTAAGLHHPNIATIHTVSAPQSAQPYFTMQMIEGGDLSELLHNGRCLSLNEALPLLTQIADALDYAHGRGVIHRDVKPANILLECYGDSLVRVKLVDFGIARAQQDGSGTRLTKAGMIVGTPEYMSPEQAEGKPDIDYRTDIYSLGIVAYEMLCGQPPFRASAQTSAVSVLMSHMRDLPQPPIEYAPSLPQGASNAILTALSKVPSERFNSCSDFINALTIVEDHSLSAPRYLLPASQIGGGRIIGQVGSTAVTPLKESEQLTAIKTNIASNNRRFPVIIAMLASILGAILIGASLLKNRGANDAPLEAGTNSAPPITGNPIHSGQSMSVAVPDLAEQNEQEARRSVEQASLKLDVTTDHSATVKKGQILSQKPPKDILVEPGATVHIVVSTGPSPEKETPNSTSQSPKNSARSFSNDLPDGTKGGVVENNNSNSAVDTADVASNVTTWKNDWQRLDFEPYIAHYAPEARIFSNHKWHDYQSYYKDEQRKFAGGGRISITISNLRVNVTGNEAIAKFADEFQRIGGASKSWHSYGEETQTWRKISQGKWLIYEDVTSK